MIGTVTFERSSGYKDRAEFRDDADKHRIVEDAGGYDWQGDGERYAWHVGAVRALSHPVPAGAKTMKGFVLPKALEVTFPIESSDPVL